MAIAKIKLPDDSTVDIHDSRIPGVDSTPTASSTNVITSGAVHSALNDPDRARIFYGTCATAAATGAKVVTCPSFTSADLDNGTILLVKFASTNTAAVADLTLNVNGTGAVDVKKVYNYATSDLSNAGEIRGIVHQFIYWEGTSSAHWYLVGVDYNTNTTYSSMTQAELDAGTGTTGRRITPKLLRDNFYTEDEVDALIGSASMPILYIGDSSNPLTADQKTHNNDSLSALVGMCVHKEVKFVDVSDADSESVMVLNTVVDMGSDSYAIDFVRFIGIAGTRIYQSFTCAVAAGDLLWSNATSVNFLLSDSISTNIQTDKTSDTKMASPKAVYEEVHPSVATSQPAGGMLPNVLYKLGTLSGSVTFSLAAATDSTIANPYHWTFSTSATAPTITWPAGLTWSGGSAPTINASKHYEVMVQDGYATSLEF